ncbi:NADH:flavin oxidoreductase/NADH oxidase [Corynebacterium halotolerans]|uniref:NADH-dependent flavin oxidoreductase n=1 Tax=Corynebacterium halotolerans YIM 70093 = DSM 44683 TaxID=1121362 RepID=M1NWC2_9CORY|nr:NADH:flavin oxidoreductase/NADH oxidase [Corynebacterium halotolerans]AGF73787.1 NADH-dependent flavin oxidoreductase [Corynebacterium halotolerans YIM 70093 = DSM 44683]
MSELFSPFRLRDLELPNRVWMPPMCQYHASDRDGTPEDWHLVHYGARAAGGFGLIIAESTGIVPEGRISPLCTGLWNDRQEEAWARIVSFVHSQGTRMGIQLNHAGRKSSTVPALPNQERFGDTDTIPPGHGGWEPVGPSAVANAGLAVPREMTTDELYDLPEQFAAAAERAVRAGFDAVEIHGAHGYLLHQFLTPLANKRTDSWGGSFENRTRLIRLVVSAVRAVIPETMPLIVRLSATDWVDAEDSEPSWGLDQTIALTHLLRDAGVDLIDVTTGGAAPADIPVGPNYQARFAEEIRRATGVPTAAVGLITEPAQAEAIVAEDRADAVLIGRAALRDALWPHRAAHELGTPREEIPYPGSYARGAWRDPAPTGR